MTADELDDYDDIGTSRWFGESWGAPVCIPAAQVGVWVVAGQRCQGCGVTITDDNQGIGVPMAPEGGYGWWHLECFLRAIAGDVADEVLGRMATDE